MNVFENALSGIRRESNEKSRERSESVECVTKKLKKEYGRYEGIDDFIDYLGAMEKIFLRAKAENFSGGFLKEKLIEIDIYAMSSASGIDQAVFNRIYEDFRNTCAKITKVAEVAEKLSRKYSDCPDCLIFIGYVRDVYQLFSQAEKERWTLERQEEEIIALKMRVLAADGVPPFEDLEKIYKEFRECLKV